MTRARLIIAASEWRERRIRRAAERVLGAPCECGRARIGKAHGYAVEPAHGEHGGAGATTATWAALEEVSSC